MEVRHTNPKTSIQDPSSVNVTLHAFVKACKGFVEKETAGLSMAAYKHRRPEK